MKRKAAKQIQDILAEAISGIVSECKIEFNSAGPPDKYDETLVILDEDWNIEIIYAAADHILIQENGHKDGRQTFLWLDADLTDNTKHVILNWISDRSSR